VIGALQHHGVIKDDNHNGLLIMREVKSAAHAIPDGQHRSIPLSVRHRFAASRTQSPSIYGKFFGSLMSSIANGIGTEAASARSRPPLIASDQQPLGVCRFTRTAVRAASLDPPYRSAPWLVAHPASGYLCTVCCP
jgi:hypothetical protein